MAFSTDLESDGDSEDNILHPSLVDNHQTNSS